MKTGKFIKIPKSAFTAILENCPTDFDLVTPASFLAAVLEKVDPGKSGAVRKIAGLCPADTAEVILEAVAKAEGGAIRLSREVSDEC